jgi:hypothetical protein
MALQALIFVMSGDPTTGPVGIPNATVRCSGVSTTTSAIGQANLSVPSIAVGQQGSLTISASGFATQTQSLTATQYVNSLTVYLTPAASSSLTRIFTVTSGSAPIAGAQIFANGGASVTTASDGTASVSLQQGSNTLQVSAAGYQTETDTIDSAGAENTIVLTASSSSAGQILTLVSSPPASTLQIGTEGGLLGSNGSYTTQNSYPPGTYSVTLTSGTQTSTTSLVVVAGTTVYQLTPVAVTDTGSGASLQTVSSTGAAAPTSSNPASPATSNQATAASPTSTTGGASGGGVPNYEWVNPISGFGRYFTATQARMYIGNLFIEELAGVQFVLQANKVPLYGYAADLFDAIGQGKSLVQGQLMVQFISEGYLYTVLNEYKRSTGATSATDASAQVTFQNLMNAQMSLQATNPQTPAIQAQIAVLQQERQQMLAADPTLASTYKRTTLANSTTAVGPNGVYQNVPFDIVLELEGGGRTVKRRLSNCILTSNEQIYGDSDTPLIDSYGFICRKLR